MRLVTFLFLVACGSKSNAPAEQPTPKPQEDCVKGGCSGTLCTTPGNEVVSTCEYKPEYACYQQATCARQPDGKCGWTQTPELTACLAHPPPVQGGAPH
jgi:eight-cysteine-cluster-containing protein